MQQSEQQLDHLVALEQSLQRRIWISEDIQAAYRELQVRECERACAIASAIADIEQWLN